MFGEYLQILNLYALDPQAEIRQSVPQDSVVLSVITKLLGNRTMALEDGVDNTDADKSELIRAYGAVWQILAEVNKYKKDL